MLLCEELLVVSFIYYHYIGLKCWYKDDITVIFFLFKQKRFTMPISLVTPAPNLIFEQAIWKTHFKWIIFIIKMLWWDSYIITQTHDCIFLPDLLTFIREKKKWQFGHHLLTLDLLQTSLRFFCSVKDLLKNLGNL